MRLFIAAIVLHFGMSVFTYGHAFNAADKVSCYNIRGKEQCFEAIMVGPDSFIEGMFWPYYWSRVLQEKA